MWSTIVDTGTCWHNPRGVLVRMRQEVVLFDVPHVHCVLHSWGLVHVLHIVEQVRILVNHSSVASEVHHVCLHCVQQQKGRARTQMQSQYCALQYSIAVTGLHISVLYSRVELHQGCQHRAEPKGQTRGQLQLQHGMF